MSWKIWALIFITVLPLRQVTFSKSLVSLILGFLICKTKIIYVPLTSKIVMRIKKIKLKQSK